jgi:hypothetical protein
VTTTEQLIEQVEGVGGVLALNGERIHVRIPEVEAYLLDDLRARREEVALLLRERQQTPLMPTGVRLVRWEPQTGPVILTHYAVVQNVRRFIFMTLLELKAAIEGKRWQSGHWSVRDLMDRLEQCGLCVEIESQPVRASNG